MKLSFASIAKSILALGAFALTFGSTIKIDSNQASQEMPLQVQSTTVAQVPSPQIQATLAQTQKVSINDYNSYQANDYKLNNYSTLMPNMNQPIVNSVTFKFGGDSAEASGLKDAGDVIEKNWGWIVENFWSRQNRQVYITNFSQEEVKKMQNQYRDRFGGILHDRCVNKVANLTLDGWQKQALIYTQRHLIASRVEDGYGNCYIRLDNANADRFERARGW
jgi:hypothetical protein